VISYYYMSWTNASCRSLVNINYSIHTIKHI